MFYLNVLIEISCGSSGNHTMIPLLHNLAIYLVVPLLNIKCKKPRHLKIAKNEKVWWWSCSVQTTNWKKTRFHISWRVVCMEIDYLIHISVNFQQKSEIFSRWWGTKIWFTWVGWGLSWNQLYLWNLLCVKSLFPSTFLFPA